MMVFKPYVMRTETGDRVYVSIDPATQKQLDATLMTPK